MRFLLALTMAFFGLLAIPTLASAQATRTWVSGVGDDVNPCSRTAPCKTFAGAISKTAVGGEISVLDPGGFGALTITKSISIVGVGAEASILASGTNGITVSAAGATVSIRGLSIEGAGTGLNGINIVDASNVHVEDCVIRGFTQAGIQLGTANATRVHIRHASIFQNAVGVQINAGAASNGVLLEDSTLETNSTANVVLSGANAVLVLSNTSLLGSSPGITATGGATTRSFGNNRITNGGVINQTLPLQ
jgi:hypothetical protein